MITGTTKVEQASIKPERRMDVLLIENRLPDFLGAWANRTAASVIIRYGNSESISVGINRGKMTARVAHPAK